LFLSPAGLQKYRGAAWIEPGPATGKRTVEPHRISQTIHGRNEVNDSDIKLIANVAISSIPGHLRPIIRELRLTDKIDTATAATLCRVTAPTARRYLKEIELLGIGLLAKGSPETNHADAIALADQCRWLKLEP
jgi:hypothetical protein